MTDKRIIDGKECRYWFRSNSSDYRKCSLRGENDNCDEIKDCFVKELLGKLELKGQECEELKKRLNQAMYLTEGTLRLYSKRQNIKYKQALDEIKEIAEKQCNACEALTPIDEYKDCKKCWQGVILQKISECEVYND